MSTSPYESPYDNLPISESNMNPKAESPTPPREVKDVENEQPKQPSIPPLYIPLKDEPGHIITDIKGYGKTTEYLLSFEDSLLVPDTMADMDEILFTETKVSLQNPTKLTYKSDDSISGDITVYTVYQPSEGPIDVVKAVIPFKSDDCLQNSTGDLFKVTVSTREVSAQLVNERKFNVKGKVVLCLLSMENKTLSQLTSPEDEQLIFNINEVGATCLVDEVSDSIEISQEITLKEAQPEPTKILYDRAEVSELHRQITSGKLVINGMIRWKVLYLASDVFSLSGKSEFTQFIPISKDLDPNLLNISFREEELKFTIESANKLLISGNIFTSVHCFENRSFTSTKDAYHKIENLYFDVKQQPLHSILDVVTGELSTREVVNLDTSLRETNPVLAGSCEIATLAAKAANNINVESEILTNILAFSNEDVAFTIRHNLPLNGILELPQDLPKENLILSPFATIKDFWANAINSRQLEINVCLRITTWLSTSEEFSSIENLRFAMDEDSHKLPSLAIYVVSEKDSLWDVAKRYRITIDEIAQLNNLDISKPLASGTKLLISR